jgi:type I site-specific restriction endonuclease
VSEGFDVPDADLLIQARPTKSKLLYQQQLGRIMRPLPGTVDGLQTAAARHAAISSSKKPIATVIDFVGNAGRHKLVHAVDVLGGKISEKARELAERELRKTGAPTRVDELVIEAERREREERDRAEAARKARLTGRATYTSRMINPFDAFDIVAPPDRAWDRSKHLSPKQCELLQKQGIDPQRMSYSEGRTILNEVFRRFTNKLCSVKQAACLKRFGYETKEMTRETASTLITQLKENGWRKPNVSA